MSIFAAVRPSTVGLFTSKPAALGGLCSNVFARGLAFCHRARRGLYAGRLINYGNNVSHSKRRTRMRQLPNVQNSSFFSKTLGRVLKFRATTHAIRCVDKAGDIDRWLMKSPKSLILYPEAIALKKKIEKITKLKAMAVQTDLEASMLAAVVAPDTMIEKVALPPDTMVEEVAVPARYDFWRKIKRQAGIARTR
ncbi:ribosomal L28 family-domain-containing protein [Pavlovales sp. CCMP2436]|nr:ribosomal L28 family-domain-containing protein [Pavlovales sp. CCMP2436]|mmetsp:Transcript_12512/g.29280  ORF Transcript_12512/g.29280 Transcript_12512/m.29280 type:complete len:194 (+) Transcript_12512:31-612(+)